MLGLLKDSQNHQYNLFIYFVIQDRVYLYYVLSLSFLILIQFTINGLSTEYLWFQFSQIANQAMLLMICLALFFLCLFSKTFLETPKTIPRIDKIITGILYLSLLGIFLLFVVEYSLGIQLVTGMAVAASAVLIGAGVQCWRQGLPSASIYLIAWASLLLGGVIFILNGFGLLPHNFLTQNALQIGLALEVTFFSLALAHRINLLKEEKELAQLRTYKVQREAAFMLEEKNTRLQKEITEHQQTEKALLQSEARLREMNDAYYRFTPNKLLNFLGKSDFTEVELGNSRKIEMSVLFADVRNFTSLSEKMTPEETFRFLNSYLGRMVPVIQAHQGVVVGQSHLEIQPLFDGLIVE